MSLVQRIHMQHFVRSDSNTSFADILPVISAFRSQHRFQQECASALHPHSQCPYVHGHMCGVSDPACLHDAPVSCAYTEITALPLLADGHVCKLCKASPQHVHATAISCTSCIAH